MAKYIEQNGQLVPVDSEGKKKAGKAFPVAIGSTRKSFAELARERAEAAQAGGQDALETGAQTPPPAAQVTITCKRCGEQVENTPDALLSHVCEDTTPAVVEVPDPPPPADSPSRICALDGCSRSLEGLRKNQRYCSDKHKRRAAYLRRRANG